MRLKEIVRKELIMYLLIYCKFCSFQGKPALNVSDDFDISEVVPRERSGRQKKVITYALSDDDDSDY